jgi:very-short-patch-repair endonuclease
MMVVRPHPARMHANPAVLKLLSEQDGLITCAQAAELGMSERTLRRRVRVDGWQRVAPRVFLAGGHPFTATARVRTAGLWAAERAAVSGPAAAFWLRMRDEPPGRVHLTAGRGSGLRDRPGIRVRRRDLDPADLVRSRRILLTGRSLTALETAIAVPEGSEFLDRALQKHVKFDDVYASYCRNLGAHGFADVARLLTAAADRADSAAERLMLGLLRGAGVTGWQHGHPFGPWEIDFAFPVAKVAVEVDGWAWHMDVERFRADRHKGNALVRNRWDLLRFTWHDLTHRPDYVLGEISAALATAATAS